MAATPHFVPEIKCDDPLRDAIAATVDEDFINVDPFRNKCWRRSGVGLNHLDVAVVPLSGFGDVDGRGMHPWYATLWLLNTIHMLVGMFYTSTSKYSPGHAQHDWGTSTSSTTAA